VTKSDRGFTIIELLIVVAIIAVVAALSVVGLLRVRAAAAEASAIGSLRSINSGQQAYASSCANGFYASTLPILLSPPVGGGAAFISPDLGGAVTVSKSGYLIRLARASDAVPAVAAACNVLGTAPDLVSSYYSVADPVSWATGSRHFWTNTRGAIYFDRDNPIGHTEGLTRPPAPAQPLESAQ
jgi:prepilin-type N-terminal cleavage/methylation domain-containing protein